MSVTKAQIGGFLLGIAVLAVIAMLSFHWQSTMEAALPPRTLCANEIDAYTQATAYQKVYGGVLVRVSGTGSMAPYIPASAPGKNPKADVVAYVITVHNAKYIDIRLGKLVIYAPVWSDGNVMHSAGLKDSGGWIMSGLANKRSEPQWRVTESNFIGIAAHTFTWPQN